MDTKTRSKLQEKARGTDTRNDRIRELHAKGYNDAEIGRLYRMPRQNVRRIRLPK